MSEERGGRKGSRPNHEAVLKLPRHRGTRSHAGVNKEGILAVSLQLRFHVRGKGHGKRKFTSLPLN